MMDEAYFAMQRDRVRKVFDDWAPLLGLGEWAVDINYHIEPFETREGSMSERDFGTAHVDCEYRRAQLNFRCDLLATESDDELEYCVVHEAMHILLNGQRAVRGRSKDAVVYREYERLFEEHTATTLALAFIRARKASVPA